MNLRPMEEDDVAPVANLIARVFGREPALDGAERLHWLLYRNPEAAELPRKGWILEAGGVPVGFLANVARQMLLGGAEVLAACTAHYAVLPSHRVGGLMLAKAFFEQRGPGLLLCTTGNASSVPILRRFGAEPIAGGDKAALFVFDARPVIAELLRRRGWPERPARLATAVIGTAAALAGRTGARWPAGRDGLQVCVWDRFDGRADALMERCRGQYGATSKRSAATLNWLFVDGPASRPPTRIFAALRGEHLEGYLVCQDRVGRTTGIRRRHVMDVFTPREAAEVFSALVGEAGSQAQRDGLDTLEFRSIPEERLACLTRYGARRRLLDENPFLVRSAQGVQAPDPKDAQQWYLTPSDGDGAGW